MNNIEKAIVLKEVSRVEDKLNYLVDENIKTKTIVKHHKLDKKKVKTSYMSKNKNSWIIREESGFDFKITIEKDGKDRTMVSLKQAITLNNILRYIICVLFTVLLVLVSYHCSNRLLVQIYDWYSVLTVIIIACINIKVISQIVNLKSNINSISPLLLQSVINDILTDREELKN